VVNVVTMYMKHWKRNFNRKRVTRPLLSTKLH